MHEITLKVGVVGFHEEMTFTIHPVGRFKDSKFGTDDDVEAMARAFDKPDGVKCMFSNPNIPYYVKFGGLRDTDRDFGIVGGKFRLEGYAFLL